MRPLLEPVHEQERKSNAGRKPFDVVLMFKLLILQTLYNLVDEQVDYQICDRLSFARCLGLGIEDAVPDATTVWRFRECFKELGLIDTLFDRFGDFLAAAGDQAREGQIVAASIVPVPIQRNQREENRRIKEGEVPADLSAATPANVHDSRVLDDLIDPDNEIRASGPTVPTAVRKRNGCWRRRLRQPHQRKRTPYPPAH